MIHKLKLEEHYYKASADNDKTFEVRLNDRDFNEGDLILLCETKDDSSFFTGKCHFKEIKYILRNSRFLKEDYQVLGLGNSFMPVYINEYYVVSLSEEILNQLFTSHCPSFCYL